MVSDPPPCCGAIMRAEPKKALGFCMAVASRPPDMVRPVPRSTVLWARARRVIESSTITTSFPVSTRRRARSSVISATSAWRLGGMSNDEATTSPYPHVTISLTSSGRSSTRRMSSAAWGWLIATPSTMACSSVVLPARAGATMSARWP